MKNDVLTIKSIQEKTTPIFKRYPVEKAILFGSYAKGNFTNNTLYKFIGRMLLLSLFVFISIIVFVAYKKRVKEGRATL